MIFFLKEVLMQYDKWQWSFSDIKIFVDLLSVKTILFRAPVSYNQN